MWRLWRQDSSEGRRREEKVDETKPAWTWLPEKERGVKRMRYEGDKGEIVEEKKQKQE